MTSPNYEGVKVRARIDRTTHTGIEIYKGMEGFIEEIDSEFDIYAIQLDNGVKMAISGIDNVKKTYELITG